MESGWRVGGGWLECGWRVTEQGQPVLSSELPAVSTHTPDPHSSLRGGLLSPCTSRCANLQTSRRQRTLGAEDRRLLASWDPAARHAGSPREVCESLDP